MAERRIYTVAEVAAAMTPLSTWAIYQHVKDGSFPVKPIRVGSRIFFPSVQIDALLAGELVS